MRKWFGIVLVAVFGVLLSGRAIASEEKAGKGEKKSEEKGGKKKPTGWDVVQVGDEIKVVQAEKVADLRKEISKDNKDALDKAKKEKKKPQIKTFKFLKQGLATKEEADKYVEKLKKDKQKGDKGATKPDHKSEKEGHASKKE